MQWISISKTRQLNPVSKVIRVACHPHPQDMCKERTQGCMNLFVRVVVISRVWGLCDLGAALCWLGVSRRLRLQDGRAGPRDCKSGPQQWVAGTRGRRVRRSASADASAGATDRGSRRGGDLLPSPPRAPSAV